MNYLRLRMCGTTNLLSHGRPLPGGQVWEVNCSLGARRLVDCLDYAHIRQALDS
jgi:hypothetical protein